MNTIDWIRLLLVHFLLIFGSRKLSKLLSCWSDRVSLSLSLSRSRSRSRSRHVLVLNRGFDRDQTPSQDRFLGKNFVLTRFLQKTFNFLSNMKNQARYCQDSFKLKLSKIVVKWLKWRLVLFQMIFKYE